MKHIIILLLCLMNKKNLERIIFYPTLTWLKCTIAIPYIIILYVGISKLSSGSNRIKLI